MPAQTAAQVLIDGQNVDKGQLRALLGGIGAATFDPSLMQEPWGYSPSSTYGGAAVQSSQQTSAPNPGQPNVWIENHFQADAAETVDFAGAYLSSVPLGIYVQHTQAGSNPANNAGTHSIMGYAVNAASGDNDVIAVSGRARKRDVAGGIGDACGVWGSAYCESLQNGGVMGMETHIYQNAPGSVAEDRLNSKWSAALHVYSDSTGSAAKAGVAIDASGQSAGRYGYWNAVIIDKNCFAGGGIAGTVGINMASCDAFNCPQFAIKFGAAWGAHIYAQAQNLSLLADNSIYLDTSSSVVQAGGSSVFVKLGTSLASNLTVLAGDGAPAFVVKGADHSVHIKAGTAIVADL